MLEQLENETDETTDELSYTMVQYEVVLKVESYIADPYWAEQADLIDIQKKSGMNRARSEDKRDQALAAWLKKEGITPEAYAELERMSNRSWYRLDDTDLNSEIVIPRHQLSGCLVQACKSAPQGARFKVDDLRSKLRLSQFTTGRAKPDALFRRYVKNDTTNQRRLHVDEVLNNFEARGVVTFNPSVSKVEAVRALIEYAMVFIGVGAARKMGYGRGDLVSFEPLG